MRVNKVCKFDRSHLHREPIPTEEPDVQVVSSVYDDETGLVSQNIEHVPYRVEDDVRLKFRDTDFSLSVILENEGVQGLKTCKYSSDAFTNADNIDATLENVESLRLSAESIVQSSKNINNE